MAGYIKLTTLKSQKAIGGTPKSSINATFEMHNNIEDIYICKMYKFRSNLHFVQDKNILGFNSTLENV